MKKHTKVYMDFFQYGTEDFVPCEICAKRAVDVHHIEARGMGGSSEADVIENLIALCREDHNTYGDIADSVDMLFLIHRIHMKNWTERQNKPFEFEAA